MAVVCHLAGIVPSMYQKSILTLYYPYMRIIYILKTLLYVIVEP